MKFGKNNFSMQSSLLKPSFEGVLIWALAVILLYLIFLYIQDTQREIFREGAKSLR